MPEMIRERNVIWYKYSDDELTAAWSEDGQGHKRAVERGDMCVVFECTPVQALLATRAFVEKVFAVPTCCHYDGETLSLYCGDAGVGGYENCKSSAKGIAKLVGYFAPNRKVSRSPETTGGTER